MKLLLSEREARERIGVGRSTLYRLMGEGKLRPLRIGRLLRFSPEELERFVVALKEEAQADAER